MTEQYSGAERQFLPQIIGYNAGMKTLSSSLQYADADPHQFRLHVLEHGKKHGVVAALEAFGISRRTYFNWQKKFRESKGKLRSLIPRSTRPKRTRVMVVDDRLVALIKEVREEYGRIGKEKLKLLVAAYAQSLGIPGYGATKIGKIIKRNNYFFERKKLKLSRASRERRKRSPKGVPAGYLEMDSVHVHLHNTKLVFVTAIDVTTRVAYAERVGSASSLNAATVLQHFQQQYAIPIYTIQTDNGSEFLGDFDQYLERSNITHLFTYPRSPKINGHIERFNRSLQEECIQRCDTWAYDKPTADLKLQKYLQWYNTKRPHASLHYQPPLVYLNQIT